MAYFGPPASRSTTSSGAQLISSANLPRSMRTILTSGHFSSRRRPGLGPRKAAGILGHSLNRAANDPNTITAYLIAKDQKQVEALLQSDALRAAMKDAGVDSPPQIMFVSTVEDAALRESGVPALFAIHDVEDYARWKVAFDADAGARSKAGVIGHAVNRVIGSPSTVAVYLQARSSDALEGLARSPELAAKMREAGVKGPPTFLFMTTDESVQYLRQSVLASRRWRAPQRHGGSPCSKGPPPRIRSGRR